MRNIVTIILILVYSSAFSQATQELNISTANQYSTIDSLAKTVKYNGDLAMLTDQLTKGNKTELEKARAIFIWITHNIAYDYKLFNKKKNKRKSFKCKKNINCDAEYAEWKSNYVKKIITKEKGICSGYASLFEEMCKNAGIQCSIVSGYIKDSPGEIGKMGILDHAWNVMLIDEKYYFLDATWAAGYVPEKRHGKLKGFRFMYNDYYWLTPIDKLSRNHFPKDSVWIKNTTYTKAKANYKNTAYIKSNYLAYTDVLSPDTGVLNIKTGDTIHFEIACSKNISYIQAIANYDDYKTPQEIKDSGKEWNEEEIKKQKYLPFKKEGDIYYFNVIANNKNLRFYDIFFDHQQVLRFKINTIKSLK